jgi:NADH-quinone oxidoreductase subunit F/NAD(P)H dehydrogenase (quinone)/NADP-reducing hydrogenase subunit HndC
MAKLAAADLERIRDAKAKEASFQDKIYCMICGGTGCHATGSIGVKEALEKEIAEKQLSDKVKIVETGCNGFCAMGPILVLQPEGIFYQKLSVDDIPELVESHLIGGKPVERLLYKDPVSKKRIEKQDDIPFFAHQKPIALRNKGLIDPEQIEDYIAKDGYFGAAKALFELTPQQIVEEVKTSGMRGRGGAGFPTGLKWQFCQASPGEIKYVLCNADEGDPGAFMDRSILEADPHAVLEGMIIAARAIDAHQGYIYARTEYPLAIRRLGIAIEQAKEYGLLGTDILGSGFDFDIEIYQGAGAFVCGEETALMRSIEGKRGMPRPRPPFPAHKGLWEKPSVLNNVETLANIGQIIRKGGKWYAGMGTETSKGTKVFALSGDVNNIGLVEVPMGTSLRKLIFDIGGGIPKKKKFKAVQLGGPSGGCVPEEHLDTPVDYEAIAKVGAIMGSGGVIIMDEDTCMVDMARFFMDFIQDESCGKCTPCREGTRRLLQILEKISEGRGESGDIETMETLSAVIKESALCGLGQTGPNPVLSTLRYFRDEYEAHIYEKRCPAKRCVALLEFRIDPDICTSCGACFRACPAEAIAWKKKEPARIDKEKCIKCLTCFEKCKFGAIF